jgi:hypothetical protein
MRLGRRLLPMALAAAVAASVLALPFARTAEAFALPPCHDDTSVARTNSHGSPLNGSFGHVGAAPNHSNSYYYLDAQTGSGCGAGTDGLVHAVGRITANGIGVLPGCTPSTNWGPPCSPSYRRVVEPALRSETPSWGLEFKNAATGAVIACTGGNGSGGTDCPRTPNLSAVPGDATVEFRYNGPVTHLRFRIANEYDDPIWETATLDIVACSTCEPRAATSP